MDLFKKLKDALSQEIVKVYDHVIQALEGTLVLGQLVQGKFAEIQDVFTLIHQDMQSLTSRIEVISHRFTATQWASINDIPGNINLARLGKLGKKAAGSNYTVVPHVRYGHVGFLSHENWAEAYAQLMSELPLTTVREYLMAQGISSLRSDRRRVEAAALKYSTENDLEVGHSTPSSRSPNGCPAFCPEAIEEAMCEVLTF